MKGGGESYKEACTMLKAEFVKGRIFNDSHGRQLTILEVPKDKKPIEVEVTTKSSKPNEKRGKAKVHMWQPSKKKPCTIMVSMYTGSDYVFVKTVMEKFIKPFMDAIISEPDEDPIRKFRVKSKDNSVKVELSDKCDECGQLCKGKRGVGIHMGRMHGGNKSNVDKKRKYDHTNDLVPCVEDNKDTVNESRVSTPLNKSSVKEIIKDVSAQCFDCDLKISATNGKELILKTIKHKSECSMKQTANDAQKDSEIIPSPPRKKVKDRESKEVEGALEYVLNKMKKMEVDENEEGDMKELYKDKGIEKVSNTMKEKETLNQDTEISEDEVIPERFKKMLLLKGLDIKEHKLIRVGGGGKCGANCISLLTTGEEEMAGDIAENKKNTYC